MLKRAEELKTSNGELAPERTHTVEKLALPRLEASNLNSFHKRALLKSNSSRNTARRFSLPVSCVLVQLTICVLVQQPICQTLSDNL